MDDRTAGSGPKTETYVDVTVLAHGANGSSPSWRRNLPEPRSGDLWPQSLGQDIVRELGAVYMRDGDGEGVRMTPLGVSHQGKPSFAA